MKSNGRASAATATLLTLASLGAADGPARAADPGAGAPAIERRWIPSASFYSMGQVDQRSAQMSADTSVQQGAGNLDNEGQSFGLPWSIGGTLDIASPVILDLPGRPRLFAHGDVGFTYDVDDPVATVGDPGAPPELPPSGRPTFVTIQNVGASVRAEAKPLTFSGGIGTVFSFEFLDRGFRIRPSLEWMYRRDTMKAVLGGGETESTTGNLCVPACRTLFIKAQTEKGFHSLGPGIELEADVGRFGEFQVGWYGAFRAFYLVGDRKANLRSSGSWTRTDGQPTTRADTPFVTEYEREPWHYRFGMGIRVLWSPEE